ncbi:hypothetical protein CsatB_030507 [Cannabis sativa]
MPNRLSLQFFSSSKSKTQRNRRPKDLTPGPPTLSPFSDLFAPPTLAAPPLEFLLRRMVVVVPSWSPRRTEPPPN